MIYRLAVFGSISAICVLASCATTIPQFSDAECRGTTVEELIRDPDKFAGRKLRILAYLSDNSPMSSVQFAYATPKNNRPIEEFERRVVVVPADKDRFFQANSVTQSAIARDGLFLIEGTYLAEPVRYKLGPFVETADRHIDDATLVAYCNRR